MTAMSTANLGDEGVRTRHDSTRLVIYAAYRIAQHCDLPRHLNVRTLITSASEVKTNAMVSWYTQEAFAALREDLQVRPLVFGRRVAEAGVLAMSLRTQAQGHGPTADSAAVVLLTMVLAAALIRQPDDRLGELYGWLTGLAEQLGAMASGQEQATS